MTGVRFSEDWLAQHQAKMAGHKAVALVPAPVEAAPAPVSKRTVKRPEQALQISGIKLLDVVLPPEWRVVHIGNGVAGGGAQAKRANAIRKAMGVRAGFPDLLFVGPLCRGALAEAKAGDGRLTDKQKEWRDWAIAQGWPWFLFTSLPELEAGCLAAGIPLRGRLQ